MYYNEERKETYFRYMEEKKKNSSKNVLYIFTKISVIEEKWKKDACDFIYDEIAKLLPIFNASSENALSKVVSGLRTYTEWCCINRLSIDNINHYNEIEFKQLKQFINKQKSALATKEEIDDVIKCVPNASDKFLVLALFEGVKGESTGEFCQITLNDIDEKSLILTFPSGKKKKMSKELYQLAISSSNETVYISWGSDGNNFENRLLKDGSIINSRANAKNISLQHMERRIQSRLRKMREEFDIPSISAPRLTNAGLAYEIKCILKKYNITKDQFFFSDYSGEYEGKMYEDYVKEINSNFELDKYKKYQVKTRIYSYLD